MEIREVEKLASDIRSNMKKVIVGKDEIINLVITAVLAGGHILLEDVPGTGKTLLARTLAQSMDADFTRIQFTPDLLPSDISGINFYNQKIGDFVFRPGPVFSNIILADEINRATPRTQSVLLECMEEQQVTIDGKTMKLKSPFFVIATQNPIEVQGTFPLPEAQLDRFLMKLSVGYPDTEEGIEILERFKESTPLDDLHPVAGAEEITEAQKACKKVHISRDLLNYIVKIAEATRIHKDVLIGVSPRGTQALLKASQALAAIQGRSYVIPDDIKGLAPSVLAHRLVLKSMQRIKKGISAEIVAEAVNSVPVPAEAAE